MNVRSAAMSPSVGRRKVVGKLASQYWLALLLPILWMNATCSGNHVSSVVERTLEMWTPRLRWTPEQFRHINTPRLTLAQVGPRAQQSAHFRLSSCLINCWSMRLCASFWALVTALLLLLILCGSGHSNVDRNSGRRSWEADFKIVEVKSSQLGPSLVASPGARHTGPFAANTSRPDIRSLACTARFSRVLGKALVLQSSASLVALLTCWTGDCLAARIRHLVLYP